MADNTLTKTDSHRETSPLKRLGEIFNGFSTSQRLSLLTLLVILSVIVFMTINIQGNLQYVLALRAKKVMTLILVGYSIAVSTVLFQTATGNRILTPSIMGFDSLYILIQTSLVFYFGSKFTVLINPYWMFFFEVILMLTFSGLLYWFLFIANRSLHQLVLTGVVIGILFHSLSSLIQRLIDPNEFNFLQDRFFSSFNNPDQDLLWIAGLMVLAVSLYGLRSLRAYDVMSLGQEHAINLGVNYKKQIVKILLTVAILVSISTALVGPVTFLGLLVAHLAYISINSYQHRYLIPAAAMIATITLVFGQIVLEQLFSFDTNLRVIVDFFGGLAFIFLLIRKKVT